MAPNILLIMADQLAAPALPAYGHRVVRAPSLDALAARSAVFEAAYCNFPICAPSRFSMLAGRLPSAIEAWDNACEFPATVPTMAHYLRAAGYRTMLVGKMHFIGPDPLHGFHERLTTDIYPADYAWTPDWSRSPNDKPTGISMRGIVEAGPCARSLQIDYDEEVAHQSVQRLWDLARAPREAPFFMVASFTHPHSPFTIGQRWWDLYRHEDIDMPSVPEIPYEALDGHSRWLYHAHGRDLHRVTPEHVRRARHAYYGMISYVDDKVGQLLAVLEQSGLDRDTVVVFTGDHGEMMGERGMWFKQTFYEWSARVPLMVSWPGVVAPRRLREVVSLVDLLPTLLGIADPTGIVSPVDPLDGRTLLPLLRGETAEGEGLAISEYTAEGVCAPARMVRRGRWKYVYTEGLPPMLFDLEDDPRELHDRAGEASLRAIEGMLHRRLLEGWDPQDIARRVADSQRRRLFLKAVCEAEDYPAWTWTPPVDARRQYVRAGGSVGPTNAKALARFPFVPPTPPDKV
ncbi:MAG: choline-sulfatase [Rhodocyclaceae bacterium]|nr:choline-sulfatase [Rhodocyclaceae bacterium]